MATNSLSCSAIALLLAVAVLWGYTHRNSNIALPTFGQPSPLRRRVVVNWRYLTNNGSIKFLTTKKFQVLPDDLAEQRGQASQALKTTSRLSTLPAEIRLKIYRELVTFRVDETILNNPCPAPFFREYCLFGVSAYLPEVSFEHVIFPDHIRLFGRYIWLEFLHEAARLNLAYVHHHPDRAAAIGDAISPRRWYIVKEPETGKGRVEELVFVERWGRNTHDIAGEVFLPDLSLLKVEIDIPYGVTKNYVEVPKHIATLEWLKDTLALIKERRRKFVPSLIPGPRIAMKPLVLVLNFNLIGQPASSTLTNKIQSHGRFRFQDSHAQRGSPAPLAY
ncbi:hypothetical protein BT63DRAFT_145689 [Microthyrium microscopicum]|uniref:Uncharacterized protein n=1 Tax=Microthyrium microscopicum TaxID=703497 RepID=A0A6A6UMP6_9PEZI|nr:hypothetical protein BT63DRAFT_145689 [Microthyrium microscopicum]